MIPVDTARQLALSLPEVTEEPHFDKASFRVKGKIFSTLWEADKKMMVKLSLIDQSVFCSMDKNIIYPVPGGWGTKGATFIELGKVKKSLLIDVLKCGWMNVASKALLTKYLKVNKVINKIDRLIS